MNFPFNYWRTLSGISIRTALSILVPRYFGSQAGVKLCKFGDVKVYLNFCERTHLATYRSGVYEPEVTRVLCNVLMPDDIFVDVGANVGWYTISVILKRADIGKCYAYEPVKTAWELLNRGLDVNNIDKTKYDVRKLGLGEAPGMSTIKIFPDFGTAHSSLYTLGDLKYDEQTIELSTLDDQAKTFIGAPTIIKCDVEGNELNVLKGAKSLLSGEFGTPPIWFIEANYETAAMADFFPWQLIDFAQQYAPYEGYYIREGHIKKLPHYKALRHSETLILAIPNSHKHRINNSRTAS